jgi:flagellar protein FlaG
MSLDIGPIGYSRLVPAPARTPAPATGFALPGASRPAVDTYVPALPPREVLDAVEVAAARVDQLEMENRELHFEFDKESKRVIVQVKDLDGNVIRTIPPSKALDVMSGASL